MESQDKRGVFADKAVSTERGPGRKPTRLPRHYSRSAARWVIWMALLLLGIAQATTPPPNNTYFYDANGRLTAMTRSDGTSAQYIYDALGNIVQVTAVPAGQLTLFGFSPVHGAIGAAVTIYGQGFSTTPASDAVSFNGTAATVTSATANQLITTVPTGAATGPISVKVSSNTVTSSTSFIVDGTGLPPTITQATPAIVSVGGTVTVTGTQLDPVAGQTSVQIGGRDVSLSSISSTQLQFVVPSSANSGVVTAETPYGQATSPAPIYVLPSTISAANVVSTGTAQINGAPVSLNIGAAAQYGAVLFNVTSNRWLSIQATNIVTTATSIAYTVYGPGNVVIQQGTVSSTAPTIHLPQLSAGSYLATFQPNTAGAQLSIGIESNAVLTPGTSVPMAAAVVWQGKRMVFQASQGQNMELTLNNVSVTGGSYNDFYVYVYNPAGVSVASYWCEASNPGTSCTTSLWNLAAGTYTVVAAPNDGGVMHFSALLQTDINGPVLTAGTPAALTLAAGQVERVTFAGTVGGTVALQLSGVSTTPTGQAVYVKVYRPDAGVITTANYYTYTDIASGTTTLNLTNLPAAGTYTAVVYNAYGLASTATLTLANGDTGTVATNGTAQSYAANEAGENVYLSFTATQGQNLELTMNTISITGGGTYYNVNVNNATGGNVGSMTCYASSPSSCTTSLWNLPAGTYSVTASPENPTDVIHFSTVIEPDVVGAALTAGTPANLTLAAGQVERVTFAGTVGGTVALQLSGVSTTPTGQAVYVKVYRPDAGLITTANYYTYTGITSGTTTLNLTNLPAAGTYTAVVYNAYGLASTATLTLANGDTGTVATNGTAQSYAANEAGENVYLSFTATQGQNLELTMNTISITGGGTYYNVNVYNATGGNVGSMTCYASSPSSCTTSLWNLPAGTYSVTASPENATDIIHFSTVIEPDVVGAALTAGTPAALTLAAGQVERVTFAGTVGGTVALQLSGVSTTPTGQAMYVKVYRPDAGVITTANYYTYTDIASGTTTLNLTNLPAAGTYTAVVYNAYGLASTATLTLANGNTGTVATNGTAQSYAANEAGENVYLSFTATQGQNLELTMNTISITGGGTYYNVNVYNATGGNVGSMTCYASSPSSCTTSLWNLPAGKYSVTASPENTTDIIHFSTVIEPDVVGAALTAGTPAALTLAAGQVERVTFAGTVGGTVALQLSGVSTTPTGQAVYVKVYRPDAGLITTANYYTYTDITSGTTTLNLTNLPAAGTYTAVVYNAYGLASTATLTLANGDTGTVATNGTAQSYAANEAGENVYLSFTATQGQNLELTMNTISITGGGTYYNVNVYNATGGNVGSMTCYASSPSSCTTSLWNLPAGTYSVTASPENATDIIHFSTVIEPDVVGAALTAGTPAALTLAAGQVERVTFAGTVGGTVALQLSGVSTTPTGQAMYVKVYRPDAGVITTANYYTYTDIASGTTTLNLTNLPAAGTYTAVVYNAYGLASTATLTILSSTAGAAPTYGTATLSENGSPLAEQASAAGQNVTMTFNATQGQNLELTLNNASVAGASNNGFQLLVSNPSGTTIVSVYCYPTNPGASCTQALWNLNAGTYTVTAVPTWGGLIKFNALLESDVAGGALTAGTAAPINLAAGQAERFTFSGTLGGTVALQLTGVTTTPTGQSVTINVYRPDVGLITTSSYYTYTSTTAGPITLNLSNLPASGTYTVVAYTGYGLPATGTLTLATGNTGALTVNGAAQSYTANEARENVYLSFTATQGQNLELTLNNVNVTGGSYNDFYVNVYNPAGVSIAGYWCEASSPGAGCTEPLWNLAAGKYSVVISPNDGGIVNFSALLKSDVAGGALTAGTAAPINLAAGQAERFTFSGTLGGTVALQLTGVTTTPTGQSVTINVYRPDVGLITTSSYYTYTSTTAGPITLNLSNLPASGTYTVVAYTGYGLPATGTLTLATGNIGALTVNGAAQSYTANEARENVYLSFTATQGQNLELTLNNVNVTGGSYNDFYVNVYNPAGVSIAGYWCEASSPGAGCTEPLWNLAAGKYSVVISPNDGGIVNFSALLKSDVAGGVLTAGTAAPISLAAGQAERFTFSGTLGGTVALQLTGVTTTPTGQSVTINVYRPDVGLITTSSYYTYTSTTAGPITLNLSNLPASGTYTVVAYTGYGLPATGTLTLATGNIGALTVNGAAQSYTANEARENVYLSFTATQGQNLELTLNNVNVTGGSYNDFYVNVYNPAGVSIAGYWCEASSPGAGCTEPLWNLAAGKYSVVISPNDGGIVNFSALLKSDVAGGVLTAGTAAPISLAAGQAERFTFSGTLGGTVALQLTGVTTTPTGQSVYLNVYRPDGGLITTSNPYTSTSTASGPVTLNMVNLPVSGTYTVVAYTGYGLPATGTLTLESGDTAALATNGTVQNFTASEARQNVYLSFAATQGQNLELTLSNVNVVGGSYNDFYVNVYNPSGANVAAYWCEASNPGASCNQSLWNLTAGNYSVVVSPNDGGTMHFSAAIQPDVIGPAVTANVPINLSLATGQVERLTFTANAGDSLSLNMYGVSTTPAGSSMYFSVYRPDAGLITTGNAYTSSSTAGNGGIDLSNLPVGGTYTVIVSTSYGEPGSGQLLLATH